MFCKSFFNPVTQIKMVKTFRNKKGQQKLPYVSELILLIHFLLKQKCPNWFSVVTKEQQEPEPVTSIICLLLLTKQVVLGGHKDLITLAFLARN